MNRVLTRAACTLLALAALAAARPAVAGTVSLTTRAAVLTSLGSAAVVETFGDFANGPYCVIDTGTLNATTSIAASSANFCSAIPAGFVAAGVTYSTPVGTGNFFKIDGFSQAYSGGFLDSATLNAALTVAFDRAQSAFGFDTNLKMGSSFSVLIQFVGGGTQLVNVTGNNSNTLTGFGFTSTGADIAGAVITPGSNKVFAVDNFTFGPGAAVPEPGSLGLLAGFLGLGLALRRRKKDSSFS